MDSAIPSAWFEPRALSRRDILKTMAVGAAAVGLGSASNTSAAELKNPDPRKGSRKRYAAKKSINMWAFPYPQLMSLRECLQLAKDAGFEGIELNYDLESDLSPKAGPAELKAIRKMADDNGCGYGKAHMLMDLFDA